MKRTIKLTENEIKTLVTEHVMNEIEELKESVRLGFPLHERINMEQYVSIEPVVSVNETNAKRMLSRHGENGYIIVSPCRGCDDFGIDKTNDPQWKQKLQQINNGRIKEFISILKSSNFSYTPVYGGFIENFGTDKADNVYERSFMVYAHDKEGKQVELGKLYSFGVEMAKRFNQDSFLYKAPGESPKYITQNGDVDMEFGPDVSFNDFSKEYFTDLHKNSEKHAVNGGGRPTRFTFMEAYVNPTSDSVFSRAPRHYKGEVFIESNINTEKRDHGNVKYAFENVDGGNNAVNEEDNTTMQRTIRLTESDLGNMVKFVLNEMTRADFEIDAESIPRLDHTHRAFLPGDIICMEYRTSGTGGEDGESQVSKNETRKLFKEIRSIQNGLLSFDYENIDGEPWIVVTERQLSVKNTRYRYKYSDVKKAKPGEALRPVRMDANPNLTKSTFWIAPNTTKVDKSLNPMEGRLPIPKEYVLLTNLSGTKAMTANAEKFEAWNIERKDDICEEFPWLSEMPAKWGRPGKSKGENNYMMGGTGKKCTPDAY